MFLDALGFQDIESGQTSWLGRYQIDVVGGYEGTFLVFECKSTNQPKQRKLTQEINIFSGKKAEIEQTIRKNFGSKSRSEFHGLCPWVNGKFAPKGRQAKLEF